VARPIVAIVGRPNVGKSTLFNRLIGERRAIVGDEPGITRDRIYGEVDWSGLRFSLIDTGGIVPDDDAVIPANIFKQAGRAIEDSQVLIWVVDARKGITQLDEELAGLLRTTGKRVLVAANKIDSSKLESESGEFYRFGFEEVFPVSAEQGIGLGELLDALVKDLESENSNLNSESEISSLRSEVSERELRLAIIGRPNVGKSSLLNRLIGEERVIVSPVAGTTRDAIDTLLTTAEQKFRLIDTAGIRRKGKTGEMAEKLSVVKMIKAAAPAKVDDRVPHGTGQYFAVFTLDGGAEQFAAPIGFVQGEDEKLFCDQLFYYDDPRTIYDHWPPAVWDAVAKHTPTIGMTENQVRMAVGIMLESDSTREGDRVEPGRVQLVTPSGSRFVEPPPLPPDQRDGPTHFLACVRTGGEVTDLCAADIGRDVQEVITAALQSSAYRRVVPLPLRDD